MKIVRYIPDSIMGDCSPEAIELYRFSSLNALRARYPGYEIDISTDESSVPVWTDDFEIEDDLLHFVKTF